MHLNTSHGDLLMCRVLIVCAGQNVFNENETIAKYEIMDGAPVRGTYAASEVHLNFGFTDHDWLKCAAVHNCDGIKTTKSAWWQILTVVVKTERHWFIVSVAVAMASLAAAVEFSSQMQPKWETSVTTVNNNNSLLLYSLKLDTLRHQYDNRPTLGPDPVQWHLVPCRARPIKIVNFRPGPTDCPACAGL